MMLQTFNRSATLTYMEKKGPNNQPQPVTRVKRVISPETARRPGDGPPWPVAAPKPKPK